MWGPVHGYCLRLIEDHPLRLRLSRQQKPAEKNGTMTKIGAMNLKPGDLVLVKADAFKGNRKIRDRWEEETCGVVC